MNQPAPYRRILLKLSGEALMGEGDFGLSPQVLQRIAGEVKEIVDLGVQVAMVVGGGNIFRGAGLVDIGLRRTTGDQMGMLATLINALALQDVLTSAGVVTRVMSAFSIPAVAETFSARNALDHLEAGRVVIFGAGTGNPFFTTDSGASLRGIEIGADVVLKATKVDGVYDRDPARDSNAVRYTQLSYDEVLERRLGVMDATAILLCRDHGMPIQVFNMNKPGALRRVVTGQPEGTRVERGIKA